MTANNKNNNETQNNQLCQKALDLAAKANEFKKNTKVTQAKMADMLMRSLERQKFFLNNKKKEDILPQDKRLNNKEKENIPPQDAPSSFIFS